MSPGTGQLPLSCRTPGTMFAQPGAAVQGLGLLLAHAAHSALLRRRPPSGAGGVNLKCHRPTARQGSWAREPRNQVGHVSAAPPGPGGEADRPRT